MPKAERAAVKPRPELGRVALEGRGLVATLVAELRVMVAAFCPMRGRPCVYRMRDREAS
jgi:hypothetical protein